MPAFRLGIALAICVTLFLPERVQAQSIAERAGNIFRDVANQFRRQNEQNISAPVENETAASDTATGETEASEHPDAFCLAFENVEVTGYTIIPSASVDEITDRYKNRCLTLAHYTVLLRDLEQLYSDQGYKSVRAAFVENRAHRDVLHVAITEDVVESVNYILPEGQEARHEMFFLERWLAGQSPMRIYDLDHVVARLERLPSNHVKIGFGPGEAHGDVALEVLNTPTRPWHAGFGINNYGLASTGEWQSEARFSLDNPFGFNDRISLGFVRGLNDEENQDSRSFSFGYEFPTALWLFSYGLSYYDYISAVDTPAQSFKTDGFSRIHTFGANYALHRDDKTISALQFELEAKENENFISGFRLENSSQKQTIASVGLQHTRRYGQGSLFGAVTYARGLSAFGAREDRNPAPDEPHAQFNRIALDMQHAHYFLSFARDDSYTPHGGKAYPRFSLIAHGQWADKTLFASEQISIGGPYSVRGFKDTAIGGDIGGYIRSEFSYPLPAFPGLWTNKMFGQLRPFIGFDAGGILHDDQSPFERGGLTGATLGIGNDYGYLDMNASLSKTLSAPSFLNEEDYEAYFSLSVNF